jgi:hypothetical protein
LRSADDVFPKGGTRPTRRGYPAAVAILETTSAPDTEAPVPAAPAAPSIAGRRVDRALLTKVVTQVAEVSAGVLAASYGLGMIVLAGQLRALGLHNSGILTGFKHDDVLMKGFGAIVTHVPALVTLVLLVGMALRDDVRTFVHDALAPADERSVAGRRWGARRVAGTRLVIATVLVLVLLTSVWWEGTVVVVGLSCYLLLAVRRRALMSSGALMGTALVGLLVIGITTTYVNPQPPPDIRILTNDDRTVIGGLLGVGERGEWYVVKYDHHAADGLDDGELQLVPDKQVVDIQLDEPPETGAPYLYELLTGR